MVEEGTIEYPGRAGGVYVNAEELRIPIKRNVRWMKRRDFSIVEREDARASLSRGGVGEFQGCQQL